MWELIRVKMIPPTRHVRYCHSVLKAAADGTGKFAVTGLRWSESARRRHTRGVLEVKSSDPEGRIVVLDETDDVAVRYFSTNRLKAKRFCNPIVDWEEAEVWDFLHDRKVPINPLYSCGFGRVGCVGCPLAGRKKRYMEFARYPKYKRMYIAAFDRMIAERRRRGKLDDNWRIGETGRDVFHWWMEDGDVLPGQMEMEDYEPEGGEDHGED